jgi:uncharacterized protein (TIGR02300 family)
MASATKAVRGTKRTCQNADCGARFYDLARSPIVCPICESQYVLAVSAPPSAAAAARKAPVPKVPEFEAADGKPDDAPEADAEEALADIEVGDEPVAVADDETFLEEEEDAGSDVSGIVSGGDEGEEQ